MSLRPNDSGLSTISIHQPAIAALCRSHELYATGIAQCVDIGAHGFRRAASMTLYDRKTLLQYADSRADHHGKLWDNVCCIPSLVENSRERLPGFPTQVNVCCKLELLHENVKKYGTVCNTVAPGTVLRGVLRRRLPT